MEYADGNSLANCGECGRSGPLLEIQEHFIAEHLALDPSSSEINDATDMLDKTDNTSPSETNESSKSSEIGKLKKLFPIRFIQGSINNYFNSIPINLHPLNPH